MDPLSLDVWLELRSIKNGPNHSHLSGTTLPFGGQHFRHNVENTSCIGQGVVVSGNSFPCFIGDRESSFRGKWGCPADHVRLEAGENAPIPPGPP